MESFLAYNSRCLGVSATPALWSDDRLYPKSIRESEDNSEIVQDSLIQMYHIRLRLLLLL